MTSFMIWHNNKDINDAKNASHMLRDLWAAIQWFVDVAIGSATSAVAMIMAFANVIDEKSYSKIVIIYGLKLNINESKNIFNLDK